jgi:ribonuclease HII
MRAQAELFETSAEAGHVAGVDEAGRGPLAGPVVAAAVILDSRRPVDGLDDSKKLSAARREALDLAIRDRALAFAVAFTGAAEIDRVNILQATLRTMRQAVVSLSTTPALVLVDGNRCPDLPMAARAEVRGDGRFACIAAASILAKVARDRYMCELDQRYPGYGFRRHKGYGTREHLRALEQLGAIPEHRCSFAPVRALARVATGPSRP